MPKVSTENALVTGLPRWLRWLRHSAHRPGWSIGGAGFNSEVGR